MHFFHEVAVRNIRLNYLYPITGLILAAVSTGCSGSKAAYEIRPAAKSRVVVLTDMLNEADDSQTMVHLLMYANKMDIEGPNRPFERATGS